MPRQNLTANACTVCRKKRTKCDGRNPCRRCVSRGEECVYEDKMWRTKDHLRSEIEKLRKDLHQSHGLIKALAPSGVDDEWTVIKSRMQRGDPPERIADWIKSLRSPRPSTSDNTSVAPERLDMMTDVSPSGTLSPSLLRDSSSSLRGSSSHPRSVHTSDTTISNRARSWTQVTHDTEVIHRLLYHYFNRCFPEFSYVCKERFMRDFNEGTELYCSPALLNAILGFAAQSRNVVPSNGNEPCGSEHFLREARRLLEEEDGDMDLTGIQAVGVLAMAEVNAGNDESAYQFSVQCARNTILMKLRRDEEIHDDASDDHNYREAMATTFCGAFSLIRIFRLLTGRLSTQTGPLFMRLTDTHQQGEEETPEARVERGVALQQHFISQLEYCPEPMRLLYTATEIAHTFCSYHHDGGVTPADLIPAYDKCLAAWARFVMWLPKGTETNQETLFAQIWYNYILVVLFSTSVEFQVDLGHGITPKAVVVQASQSILHLTTFYRDHWTFDFIHPLLPHMVFAAAIFQLRQSFDTRLGDRVQQSGYKFDDKRKRFSEPHTPSPVHTPIAGSSLLDRRRQSMAPIGSEGFVFPPLENHVATATLRRSSNPDDMRTSTLWSLKSPHQLSEQGTQLLKQMGSLSPKAAELASILRIRSMAGPTTADMPSSSFAKPVMASHWPTPAVMTPPTGWTSGTRSGFLGPGINNIQGFAALTANPNPVADVVSEGISPILHGGPMSLIENGDVDSYFDVPSVYLDPAQQPGSSSAYSGYSSDLGSLARTTEDGGVGNLYG